MSGSRVRGWVGGLAGLAGLAILVGGAMPNGAWGQESRSLDEQLLDDLSADPLDAFDRELFGPGKTRGRAGDASEGDDDLSRRLRRELGAAAVSEDDSPLLDVARQMREVETMIGRSEVGPITQNLQEQIVADLDELIKQARKRCGSGSPGQQPKRAGGQKKTTTKPSRDSVERGPGKGTPRRPDMQQMQELIKRLWGELPERQRQRMSQSPPEEFLPKYELLIEEYFRRLAEERGR